MLHKKTSASILYYILAKLWTIFIKITERSRQSIYILVVINFCTYHKFLANNCLISTLNRIGHKSQ